MEALREEITFQQDVVVERDTKLIRSSAKVDMLEEQLVKVRLVISLLFLRSSCALMHVCFLLLQVVFNCQLDWLCIGQEYNLCTEQLHCKVGVTYICHQITANKGEC